MLALAVLSLSFAALSLAVLSLAVLSLAVLSLAVTRCALILHALLSLAVVSGDVSLSNNSPTCIALANGSLVSCSGSTRPKSFPSFEQHVMRNCFNQYPAGVLLKDPIAHKTGRSQFRDEERRVWVLMEFYESLFHHPFSTFKFVSADDHGTGGW